MTDFSNIKRVPVADLIPCAQSVVRVTERGFLVGKLYALAEVVPRGTAVSARIRPSDGSNAVICTADGAMGRRLRDALFEAVRVQGVGAWMRTDAGAWACESMVIDDVRLIQNIPLRNAINQLRALDVEWPDDPIGEMSADVGNVA